MTGLYRFADELVCITSVYDEVHVMCRDYAVADAADGEVMEITTGRDDIRMEAELNEREMKYEGLTTCGLSEGYLETLAVYRKMAEGMLARGVLLMHGSVIAVDGEGYMFTAASGTGKSTHVRLWRERFEGRAVMVNDDKPLVRVRRGGKALPRVEVYGTPWDGKHHLSNNICVPLKGVCILERGRENVLDSLTADEAIAMLCQQSYRPREREGVRLWLEMLVELTSRLGLFRLRCNMEREAADVAYSGMNDDGRD